METVEVDGSYGEGGGQILRTAVAFSIILRKKVHVSKIRAGRERPGLRPQHRASLMILRDVSGGRLLGAEIGSSEIWFAPGEGSAKSVRVDTRTAASLTLALQAVVPAVALSGWDLSLEAVGGTDVPWSPTLDYMATVAKAGLSAAGLEFTISAKSRGYYPAGGGRVTATVSPSAGPRSVVMLGRTTDQPVTIVSRCANLPRRVAESQAASAREVLEASGIAVSSESVTEEKSLSPGSSVLVSSIGESAYIGCDAIGAKGRRADEVGWSAASRFVSEWRSGASIDSSLADTLAPLLALAKEESRLLTSRATEHLRTSLQVAKLFTGCGFAVEPQGHATLLTVSPGQHNI